MTRDYIRKRLAELGKSPKGLADHLGLPQPRVSELLNGDRKFKTEEIGKAATYLEWPTTTILAFESGPGLARADLSIVMVRGAVQAGVFGPALEWPQDQWRVAPVARDPRYQNVKQFGLEVRGPSMNMIYPEGTVVVCVSCHELARAPAIGDRVVVLRGDPASDQFEATVKELRSDENGAFWLWPRSSDPNFQTPWRMPNGETDDADQEIKIVAKVIGSYRPE